MSHKTMLTVQESAKDCFKFVAVIQNPTKQCMKVTLHACKNNNNNKLITFDSGCPQK